MGKLVVSITNGGNDADRATVGFVVANAAVASGQETVVFLSTEGVRLAFQGYAEPIHEQIFLNPDCGFGTFANRPMNTAETATAKLKSMAEAARRLRAELG